MKTISRYIMTLALLLTAVTGAWAEETPLVTIYASKDFTSGSKTFDNKVTATFNSNVAFSDNGGWCATTAGNKTLTVEPVDGVTITRVKFYTTLGNDEVITAPFEASMNFTWVYVSGDSQARYHVSVNGSMIGAEDTNNYLQKIEVYGTAEPPIEVAWDPATKTGTFNQPGSDVVLTPLYAPTAMFATDGNLVLTPTAIEGIYAESTDAIVKAGTVAKIGKTENPQGIVMYAVTSTNQATAPELSAFSATLPTAKDITAAGDVDVLVWYYIKGADAPDGVAATLDNTFDNTEPACLTVQVLTNKFDLTLKAANANTIEAGKATVTVGGTAATVTDGKLQGVKMGSEVKLKANTGYKFRKVEVKKGGGAKPLANATTEDLGKVVGADGNIYDSKDAAEAANTTAVAMICYVNEGHGLALALTDEVDKMNWSTAQTTCDAHTPAITGGKWMLASKGEWDNMISAAGSYSALRDGFSSVGGTNMQSEGYWSSTEDDSSDAWNYYFSNGLWSDVSKNWNRCVRACLAF